MSAPGNPPTVAELPIVRAHEFVVPSEENTNFYYYSGWQYRCLEHVQRRLVDESEEDDGYGHDVDINNSYGFGRRPRYYYGDSYHERILPHWEAFAAMKKRQGGMQSFRIKDILIPPAPFLADKLLPALTSSNDSLVRMDLVGCGLKSDGFGCVADFLTDNASVATLDLSQNKIDSVDDAKFLALAIWNHPVLQFVNLSECELGKTEGVLAEVMGGAGNLETLLLDNNAITTEGMASVAEFVATNTAMTTLSLADNYFRKCTFHRSARELQEEHNRKYETFADNAVAVGEALKKNTSIRQLCLSQVNGMEVPAFLDSKRATELLTHLDLSDNCIGKEGAEMIADYLERNPVLIELNLECNGIGSRSAQLFAKALKANDTLGHLDLRYNNFNDKSVPFFADVLRNNTTLLSLNLASNNIKQKTGRKELLKSVCDTSSLEAVLDSNHTCMLRLTASKGEGTPETALRNINGLEDEGKKIRYKVVLALFAMDSDLFSPRSFDDVPLELMPQLLHLVQKEIGYGGFGEGVVEKTRKRRPARVAMRGRVVSVTKGFDPSLRRVHEVLSGWNQLPLLFVRGPGVLKKKRKRKRHVMSYKDDEDEDWTPRSR